MKEQVESSKNVPMGYNGSHIYFDFLKGIVKETQIRQPKSRVEEANPPEGAAQSNKETTGPK